jgi:nucleotide-binding universal stress UspA family protein
LSILLDSDDRDVDFVLHPTDLSEASERAFHHALAIAIRYSAQLTLLHAVGRRVTDNWVDFPSVRSKLAEWRAAGTTQELEARIGRSSISKAEVQVRDPVAASMQYIEKNPVNMVVLATDGRGGLSRLIRVSRAQQLARESQLLTLFVPEGGRPFVSGKTGEVSLRRIVVPVDPGSDPRPAMAHAVRSATLLDDPGLEITLLHVGPEDESIMKDVPELPYCKWTVVRRNGDPADQILRLTEEIQADAIYMSTTWGAARMGKKGGSVTERVLSGAACPVAAIPVARS